MKKNIARLLAFVLFIAAFQGIKLNELHAATINYYNFEVTDKALLEVETGLELGNRGKDDNETALVKWDISAAQKYKLSYYVEDKEGKTRRVEISLDNAGDDNVTMEAQVFTGNSGTADSINYVTRKLVGNLWTNQPTEKGKTSIIADLKLGDYARSKQEYNVSISNIFIGATNLMFRLKFVGNTVYIYTNGALKGNVNKFELRTGNKPSEKLEWSTTLFNGPKNFTITPVHLDKGNLVSTTLIDDLSKQMPGSIPGIKIAFDEIKVLNNGEYKKASTASELGKVMLKLQPQYSLTGSITDGDNSIQLDFIPFNNQDITINRGTMKKPVIIQNDQINIYLSSTLNNKLSLDPRVIEWEVLEPSMVVDSLFTYDGTATTYRPENKGHTYLEYSLNRTTNNEVQFTIQPYNINASAIYTIYSSSSYDPNDPDKGFNQKVTYQYDPSKTDNQEITAVVTATGRNYFKVMVKINNDTYISQIVYYDPNNFNPVPTTPIIKSIDNLYVVPSDETSNAKANAIGFDIEWYAPSNLNTLLNGGTLYYEMLVRRNKDDVDPLKTPTMGGKDGYAAYSKVFKVYLDHGDVVVESDLGTAGQKDATEESTNRLIRYNSSKGTFKMENVALMNFSKTSSKWEQITVPSSYIYGTATTHLKEAGATVNDDLANMTIPGNYYISLRTVYVANDVTKLISYSNESNLKSIAIDITKEVVPVPTTVVCEDNTSNMSNITEKLNFSYVDIKNYVNKMIEPTGFKLYQGDKKEERYSGDYEFYLYQKADALSQLVSSNKDALNKLEPTTVGLGETLTLSKEQQTLLKNDGIIPFKVHIGSLTGNGSGIINISGLDSNTVYYVQLRTTLTPYDGNKKVDTRTSLLSKVFTFTTITEILPPITEDKVPPAPESIKIHEDWLDENGNLNQNTNVKLVWEPADATVESKDDKIYYEFIRTDSQLSTAEQKLSVEDLVKADGSRVGFRSDSEAKRGSDEPAYISTYTSKVPTWTNLVPLQLSSNFTLYDDTLNPNHVYYYYVRTVLVVDGISVKSIWIMIPVTTSNIKGPINLKVEQAKDYSHDTKHEIVISFDAPIPTGANVPTDFDFDIAVKSELDEDYRTNYSVTKLVSKQDASLTPSGYTHFVYKITDLKAGKRYDIKVRVVDKTKGKEEGGSYPTSLYCDKVTTRTDYDPEEELIDNKYKEYLKKFDSEVEKLRRRPYWVVEQGESYKYRANYISTELGLQKEYDLVSDDEASSLYYYMPASVMVNDDSMNTVLNITIGQHSMSVRPNTLTSEHEGIKEAIKNISKDNIKDYYVALEFYVNATSESINGEKALSPRLGVNMEIVYMRQEDRLTEDDIMEALNKEIADERKDFIKQLEKKINKGIIEDDVLQELIDDAITEIEKDHAKQVSKIMKRYIKKTVSIHTIQKPILIRTELDAFLVNAYYNNGSWYSVDSYQIGNKFGIEADRLGVYIFTGQADLTTTVPDIAPYQSFIAKYNLTDFFKLDNYMIKTAVTKEQLYGATARILGAKRGTDYTLYLKNAGIKGVTGIGLNKNVRQDESIYIIMQAYEKNHNRNINSVVIKNRQSVLNIGAFQSIYRSYVYAAVELQIVGNPNSRVLPSKEMTVQEIIKMLYKIQAQ